MRTTNTIIATVYHLLHSGFTLTHELNKPTLHYSCIVIQNDISNANHQWRGRCVKIGNSECNETGHQHNPQTHTNTNTQSSNTVTFCVSNVLWNQLYYNKEQYN